MFLDQVHFEVIDYSAAVRLTERLGQTWTAGLLGGEPYVVAAAVSSEPDDLATLLRSVQAVVEEESLYAIRFMLDNEIYVLARRSGVEDAVLLDPRRRDRRGRRSRRVAARRLSASVTDTTQLYTGVDGGAGLQD